jgi:uncharacterized protein (TIGR02271 family)
MRWDRNYVKTGMLVTSSQGERLGKVIRCDPDTFVVEKGMFFPKDYELRYDHITDMRDGGIVYSLSDLIRREEEVKRTTSAAVKEPIREQSLKEPLKELPKETTKESWTGRAAAATGGLAASAATTASTAASTATGELRQRAGDKDEIRIPLMKEEIGVEKVAREVGHLRVRKTVRTEEQHFTVPVTREEVSVEHVAVPREANRAPTEMAFKEETIDLPLHEEEIRVTKRPTMREEVVIRTSSRSVDREGTETVRFEEAEVEDTRKAATPARREETSGYSSPGYRQ